MRLTPEEWVRQHFIHYLKEDIGVPPGLISVERGLNFNGRQKRFDICVSDRSGAMSLLVECKAPHVPLSKETLMQAGVYHKVLGVTYVVITNGMQHIFMSLEKNAIAPVRLAELPHFETWS